MIRTVSQAGHVAENIRRFVRELPSSSKLQLRLSRMRAWYALEGETGNWIFGPSKFVGYRDNTIERYLEAPERPLNGGQTEGALQRLFPHPVDPDSRLGNELAEALQAFLGRWGKAVRKDARIILVSELPAAVAQPSANAALLVERIVSNPAICGGRPRIRDTRIRVTDILDMLASGARLEEILEDYPDLEREDIHAALTYAARIADHRVIRAA